MIVSGAIRTVVHQQFRIDITMDPQTETPVLAIVDADGTAHVYPLDQEIVDGLASDFTKMSGKPTVQPATAQDMANIARQNGGGRRG